MKTAVIIQARMGSTRLPGKVLRLLGDRIALEWVVNAAKLIPGIDEVCIATSILSQDMPIVDWCKNNNICCFRGSESNVLSRYYDAACYLNADIIMRITSDCPFVDPFIASQVLHLVTNGVADYATNNMPPTWSHGLDCEAFTFATLESAHKNATKPDEFEHVTTFMRDNPYKFRVVNISCPIPNISQYRVTLDTKKDFIFLNKIAEKLRGKNIITVTDVLSAIKTIPKEFFPNE